MPGNGRIAAQPESVINRVSDNRRLKPRPVSGVVLLIIIRRFPVGSSADETV
ncbi:MAG: hypothetical protein IID45_03640 [Planctomycetes bacterium]|nr:hypothetical protein [Planctomycetota bacterium]